MPTLDRWSKNCVEKYFQIVGTRWWLLSVYYCWKQNFRHVLRFEWKMEQVSAECGQFNLVLLSSSESGEDVNQFDGEQRFQVQFSRDSQENDINEFISKNSLHSHKKYVSFAEGGGIKILKKADIIYEWIFEMNLWMIWQRCLCRIKMKIHQKLLSLQFHTNFWQRMLENHCELLLDGSPCGIRSIRAT